MTGFKPEQEAYALRRGFDGGRALSKSTIRARQNRWSYYRKRTRGGVTATKPFSVWTGDYLRSTYGDHSKASYQVSKGQLVIKTDLVRSVRNPWDVVVLDKKLERRLEARIQMVLNRKRPPLRDKLGSRL